MELMGLDNEAAGAWLRAVVYLWTSGPAPGERLALVAGNGWERVAFLFTAFNGALSLEWMEELREKQRIFREKASDFGAKGGRPSRGKKGTLSKKKPYPKATQRVGRMKNEDEREEEKELEVEVIPNGMSSELFHAIKRWEKYRREKRNTLTPSGREAFVKKCQAWGDRRAIAAIDHSIAQGWTGCFEPHTHGTGQTTDRDERKRMVIEAVAQHHRDNGGEGE